MCRFTIHVWAKVKLWLELNDVDPSSWTNLRNVKEWCTEAVHKQENSKKAMTSFAMLVSWEIWNERNARIFQNNISTSNMFVAKVKEEVALWSLAGAKAISIIMPPE
jgi:hypothetical protein